MTVTTRFDSIHTDRLLMRWWRDSDREPFAALNADPETMQFFPATLDRLGLTERARLHRLAAKRNIPARWAWACDDPRSLERLGLQVVQTVPITRPPRALRRQLPARYRFLLPLAGPVLGRVMRVTLFRASSPGAADEG